MTTEEASRKLIEIAEFIAKHDSMKPKQYTFAEAYEMMKAGKWMKVPGIGHAYRYHSPVGWVWYKDIASNSMGLGFVAFSPDMIESKWEEVNL